MKVIMIECTAEELRANRTVADSITDALSTFTENLVGVRLSASQLSQALAESDDESEGESEDDSND